jgi:hypothetical protein
MTSRPFPKRQWIARPLVTSAISFFSTHLLLVLWSRIAVAFDRYVSIVQPLRYQSMMNHRVSLTVIFVIYLYVTVTRSIVHVFIGASCLLFLETKTHRLRDGGPLKNPTARPVNFAAILFSWTPF